jgi:hypothetical protein
MTKLTRRYSGNDSLIFWDHIGCLDDKAAWSACYALGVALQNLEEQALRALEHAMNQPEGKI